MVKWLWWWVIIIVTQVMETYYLLYSRKWETLYFCYGLRQIDSIRSIYSLALLRYWSLVTSSTVPEKSRNTYTNAGKQSGLQLLIQWGSRCFSVIKGSSTDTCIHAFPSFLLKHRELTHLQHLSTLSRSLYLRFQWLSTPAVQTNLILSILNDSQQLLGFWTVEVKCPSPPLERTKFPHGDVTGTKFQETSQRLG